VSVHAITSNNYFYNVLNWSKICSSLYVWSNVITNLQTLYEAFVVTLAMTCKRTREYENTIQKRSHPVGLIIFLFFNVDQVFRTKTSTVILRSRTWPSRSWWRPQTSQYICAEGFNKDFKMFVRLPVMSCRKSALQNARVRKQWWTKVQTIENHRNVIRINVRI